MKKAKRYWGDRFPGSSVARERLLSHADLAIDRLVTDVRGTTAAECIDIALEISPLSARAIARKFDLEYLLDEPGGRR